jgi:ribosomal protein S18 acetylase RimI-like enzyme
VNGSKQQLDAPAIGTLASQFASYLRSLGDSTDFKLTTEAYLRDGFGSRPAFEGLVAEKHGCVLGYLLYHFGYDSDGAFRNLHIVDLYVDAKARKHGVGKGLMTAAAAIGRRSGAQELIWSVYHANDLAAAFYEKLGAKKITDLFFMKLHADVL